MKKLFAVLSVLFVMGTANVFAFGIGAQGGYTVGGNGGAAVTFKIDNVPCVFAVDLGFGSNYFAVGGTADWWIANPTISGPWGWYYGVGAYGAFATTDNWSSIGIGGRALIGTNLKLLDNFLELYLQGAWQPTFWISTSGNGGSAGFSWLSFPINVGFRFWF